MSALLKIEFGCNGRNMDGWLTTDINTCDIRQPLPWADGTAIKCYASHVIEHVTSAESMRFLKEVYRVLAPEGLVRIVVPSINGQFMGREHIEDLCTGHGHFQTFSFQTLHAMLYAAGFDKDKIFETGRDIDIDWHYKEIGESKDLIESLHVDALK